MWTSSLPTEMMSTVRWKVSYTRLKVLLADILTHISCGCEYVLTGICVLCLLRERGANRVIKFDVWMMLFTAICRDCTSHDVCNKPGDGHVLGDVTLECHGNHGECRSPIRKGSLLTNVMLSASGIKCWSVTMAFCFRKRTRLHASSTWYHLYVSRRSITTSRGIKWRCSFPSSTTRSVRHPQSSSSVYLYFTSLMCISFHSHVYPCSTLSGVGAMTWSPLACGLITGKYSDGVPECSRAAMKVSLIWPALLWDSSHLKSASV